MPEQKNVLVVENDALNLKLVNDLLRYHGYAILSTGSGKEALDLAGQRRPDLILLEIHLPDVSGIEVIRQLKADAHTKAIPIVAVTAFAMPEDRTNILANGADDYVSKPFRVVELLEIVHRYTTPNRNRVRSSR